MSRRRIYRSRKQAPMSEAVYIVTFIGIALIGLGVLDSTNEQLSLILMISFSGLLLASVVYVFIVSYKAKRKRELIRALQISQIDAFDWYEFENYVAAIFRHQGYKVKDTPMSGDFGVDLVITKQGRKTAVQIKKYKNSVNQDAVRQVVAGNAMSYYKADKTMVVTNSYFTKSVYELAKANKCELVNRDQLAIWIKDFQDRK